MNLAKSFSIYTGISIINAGVSFLLFPILTFYLTKLDYGLMSLFSSYVAITGTMLTFSVPGYTAIHFFEKDKSKFTNVFSSSFFLPIIVFVIIELTFIIFGQYFSNGIPIFWLMLVPIFALLEYLYQYLLSVLILMNGVKQYTIVSLSKIIIEVFLIYFFVIKLELGWEGKLFSWFIVIQLGGVLSILFFIKKEYLKFKFDKYILYQTMIFGAPLILHSLNKFVINQSDRIFISKMVSLEATGLYSIGYNIGMIVLIVLASVINVYSPYLIERLSDINIEKKYQILKLSYIIFLGLLSVFLILNILISPIMFRYFISGDYGGGESYVFLVSLSYVFWGVYLMFAGYVFYLKKTKFLGFMAIITILINLIFNYFLIKLNGPIGAAQSTVISFVVLALSVMIYSNSIYKMPWFNFNEIIKVKI